MNDKRWTQYLVDAATVGYLGTAAVILIWQIWHTEIRAWWRERQHQRAYDVTERERLRRIWDGGPDDGRAN